MREARYPVGAPMPRVDGEAKVTGRARYLDDIPAPDAWVGVTVRSEVARGTLLDFDMDPAFAWSSVVVVTADDIAAAGGRNLVAMIEDDQPALVPVGGRVMHHAEPLALVAAPTFALAHAAARAMRPRVSTLPPVLSIDEALRADTILYGANNVFKEFLIRKGHGTDAELTAALAAAAHTIEGEYLTGAQEQMYIEPQAMMATWIDGCCHLIGSMQCPYYVHKAMKALLCCDDDGVRVAQSVTGGGFGGKEEYPSMLAAHCALLARKAAVPVKMVYERDEDIAATTKRHPCRVRHQLALAADGTPLAVDIDVVMDGGAYLTLSPVVLSRGVLHAAGPYKCPVVRVRGRVVATNHPPHGAFRGFGAPQTTFAYERQMDKAARWLGQDPLAYRDRHALRPGDTTATGQLLEHSVGTDQVLAAVRGVAGPPPTRDGVSPVGSPVRRGRGWAFYFHGAGFTGSGEQRLAGKATVAAVAGGRFEVRSSSTDMGQGAATIFTQIAAQALGVPTSLIDVVDPSTATVPDSGPTVASRTCMIVGGLVEKAAKALRAQIVDEANKRGLRAQADDLQQLAAAVVAQGGELVQVGAYQPPAGIQWDDATYTGSAYPVYGWAACMVDLTVDLDTFQVTVDRCVHAVDVGKAINPVIVTGQIEGGTLQALGWALLESVVYREGRVANANMTNCIVPTFADAPEMETITVEVPYPHGPSGAKGVGEIPMDGPGAAVANALTNALGVAFDNIPMLPEVIASAAPAMREGA